MQKIFFVDHHDSFSQNLIVWLETQAKIQVSVLCSYDDPNLLENWQRNPLPLVLSPGPGNPKEKKPTLDLIDFARSRAPIFGVCLGHQMLGLTLGFNICRSNYALHGVARRISLVENLHESLFRKHLKFLEHNALLGSYNSLTLEASSIEQNEYVKAVDEFKEIQIIESLKRDTCFMGWQFHPESFLTSCSQELADALNAWFQVSKKIKIQTI